MKSRYGLQQAMRVLGQTGLYAWNVGNLHQDKLYWLSHECKAVPTVNIVLESYTAVPDYMKNIREAIPRPISEERIRIEKYRMYWWTKFKAKFDKREARFHGLRELRDVDLFHNPLHMRFVERDKAYHDNKKAERQQAAKDLRFRETFGEESSSEDD
ncbi:hypothetical protein L917_12450 [Phytophthora nicotianae]|uniref:Uncharacterized protein n=1 Tax=Phytophthora nicotianae TaxID=4792 RepID=W2KTG1_PHYNI|nr:hypothetical protein L917_12450 [Phytophthora nicotianae]